MLAVFQFDRHGPPVFPHLSQSLSCLVGPRARAISLNLPHTRCDLMANPGDFAHTVKQQADIVRIVGEYVKLRKAGAEATPPPK